MKKIKLLPVFIAVLLSLCLCLCACNNSDNKQSTANYTQLSKDNVYHYLAFNITVSDCVAEYVETDILNQRKYDLSCIVTIATTRAADCHFKYYSPDKDNDKAPPALIQYSTSSLSTLLGTGWSVPDYLYAQIGYDGVSAVSFATKATRIGLAFPNLSTVKKNVIINTMIASEIVSSVEGYAYHN